MRVHNSKNLWSGLMFVAIGIIFIVGSHNYTIGTGARMGPGYFPFMLGVLMTVLGAVVTFSGFKPFEGEGDGSIDPFDWKSLFLIVGAVLWFAFTLQPLGFVVALAGMILIGSFASHEFNLKESLLVMLVLTAVSLVIFVWGLELQLPVLPRFMRP